MKNKLSHKLMSIRLRRGYSCSPPGISRRLRISISMTMILLLMNIGLAQNLVNTGQIHNTGTIRIKNAAIGLPSTLNGTFELFGSDQTLSAKQYQSVRLTGTGTKTTAGGNFSIQKNLTIAAAVTLQMPKGDIITLGDSLFESGIFNGAIQKSVNLTGSTTSSNFGNIGAAISWSSIAPGITNVLRVSDSVQTGNGNASIKRYYQIQPTDATATGTITLKFSDSELNGHTISDLQLWRLGDNGTSWQRHVPVVDTLLKTISKTNVTLSGRWAIADTVRALGPLNSAAGIPATMANTSAPNIQPRILTTLNAFKIQVTDIFGTPVKNVSVQFAISNKPLTAVGQQLSDTLAQTDSLGFASSILTLGNKVGAYEVTATSGSLTPIILSAVAKYGAPDSLMKVSSFAQSKPILQPLDSLFTITVVDVGGNPVDSAQVQFAIADLPVGSFGHSLSGANVLTDSLGHASTRLTLGSKATTYKVRGTVNGVSDTATFTATALPGSPFTIARSGGDGQSGVNGQALADPFVAFITDAGGNPVPGDTVKFGIQNSETFGAVLSATQVVTNNLGTASTILTLGTRAGVPYVVQARSEAVGGSLIFSANALAGAAAATNILSGNNQTVSINRALTDSFVVRVNDSNGNAVPNASVKFVIGTVPSGALGASLSIVDATTDSSGTASTRLTLGNKVGAYTVNAEVNGVPNALFTATAVPGSAAAFAAISGSNQTAQIITALAGELIVRVVDAGGNNVANAPVNFMIDSIPANAAGQLLANSAVLSDANGFARTSFTLGNKVGSYRVKASGIGIPDTFFVATATHGAATAMTAGSTTGQTKPILTDLDVPFAVHVTDIGGNDVPLSSVQFAITKFPAGDTSASVNNSIGVTDAFGSASARLKLGSKVGTYEVTATVTVAGAAEARSGGDKKAKTESNTTRDIQIVFTASATHGAAAALARQLGNGQVRPTQTTLDTAFVVTVKDIGGNAVPLSPVSFAISSYPANAIGQQLKDTLVTTDSLGVASTMLTLGDFEGQYVVSASAPGITPVQFTANAFFIYGDPNGDIDVNVADITMLIDHIYNKNSFTVADSIKSDLNKDSKVDTADVGVLRDNILTRPLIFTDITEPVGPVNSDEVKRGGSSTNRQMKQQYFSQAVTQLEVTPQGLRLNMDNTVPVRGIELRIRTSDSTSVDKVNYLFSRAENMNVTVRTVNNDITILVYSLLNSEIQPGEGTILRLPKITSLAQIETSQVVLAVTGNTAVKPEVKTESAPTSAYPTTYRLEQNYPNPFNGSTVIRYDIPDGKAGETKVALQIFNILGQKVKTLINEPHDPGPHQVVWNGTNDNGERVASGVYFYRLITKNFLTSKKMIYVK